MGYTKLFAELVNSTIWDEQNHIRVVWITMLALKDDRHEVMASIPGLARQARVTREQCEEALKVLSSPDTDSRSKDFDGRRIQEVRGGWKIVNGEFYRAKRNEEERREYMRDYMRKYRGSEVNNVNVNKLNVSNVSPTEHNRTEHNKEYNTYVSRDKIAFDWSSSEFKNISQEKIKKWKETFPALEILTELKKIEIWILANPKNKKKNWERFIVNWLTRNQDKAPRVEKTSTNGSGSSIDAWEMEWVKMMAHLRTKGNSARMEGLSDKGRTALQAIGGMSVLGMANEYKMSELKKEFKINYLT